MGHPRVRVSGLAYLSLYVDDLRATRRFYSDLLGLDVADEGGWGFVVRAGGVDLFVHERSGNEDRQHVEMTFDVDDVDRAVEALRRAGVAVVDEPADREWGDRDAAVSDPDANTIYLRAPKGSSPHGKQS